MVAVDERRERKGSALRAGNTCVGDVSTLYRDRRECKGAKGSGRGKAGEGPFPRISGGMGIPALLRRQAPGMSTPDRRICNCPHTVMPFRPARLSGHGSEGQTPPVR